MEDLKKYKELGMDAYLKAKRRAITNSIEIDEVTVQKVEESLPEPKKTTKKKKEND